jgi:uncharacterized protein
MRRQRYPLPLRQAWCLGFLALFLVLWSGFASASDLHPLRHGEGRLWRIERGTAPPSHIMGTMHVADPRVRDLPAPIRAAFEASEQAAFELLMTPEERQVIGQMQVSHEGKSLAELVDRETYEEAVALAARYGIPEDAVDRIPPGALACLFQTPPEEFRRRSEGDLFLDLWLIQWAYDLGMRVVALEKLEEQLALFDEAPEQDQAEMLRQILDRLEEDPDALERLVKDYLAGDMRRVFREMEAELEGNPGARAFKKAFLDDRNHRMVERMAPLLERGNAFVAVGAAHLPGDEGMLHLLERQGYQVTRVY